MSSNVAGVDCMLVVSTHDPLFDSAWLRWGRGIVHAQAMDSEIDALGSEPHFVTVRTEFDPERHGFRVLIERLEPGPPPRLGLVLGDVANNFRSALDNLAWSLVSRGSQPPATLTDRQQKGVYFPITADEDAFLASIKSKLPGVAVDDVAVVHSYQPFIGAPGNERLHCLTLLDNLNNRNKHRTVHPVWWIPSEAELQITASQDCEAGSVQAEAQRQPLHVGTELAFVPVGEVGTHPHLDVEASIFMLPAIDDLIPLSTWVVTCEVWICNLLTEFSDIPPEIFEIGIDWPRLGEKRDAEIESRSIGRTG